MKPHFFGTLINEDGPVKSELSIALDSLVIPSISGTIEADRAEEVIGRTRCVRNQRLAITPDYDILSSCLLRDC